MMNPVKIFFFIPDLSGGGAERALVNLLKHWPSDGAAHLAPILVVRRWHGEYTAEIPDSIPRVVLGTERSGMRATVSTVFRLGRELRKHRPAAVVSFLSAPAVLMAARLFHPRCKVILSLQTSPAQWLENERGAVRNLVRMIQGYVFRHADYLMPISEGIARELRELYGLAGSAMTVIHNSVDIDMITRESAGDCPHELLREEGTFRIITAGRLVRQKSQEVLIEAVARLATLGKKVDLFILGQGPDLAFLEETAGRLGIRQRVHFLGFQKNPWRFFRNADLFVLPSKYEGFANVIIEAMACGLPVVSTDAPHGPREILHDGEYGLMVPVGDAGAIAQEMLKFIDDERLRKNYAERSRCRARDFDIRRISATFRDTIEAFLLTGTNSR